MTCTICNACTRVVLIEEYGQTVAYCRDCIPPQEVRLLYDDEN